MQVWLVRAGSHGEFEHHFLATSQVYATWDQLKVDLSLLKNKDEVVERLSASYPDAKPKAHLNWAGQIWSFATGIKKGDLIVLPLKSQRTIQIGEATGAYRFEPKNPTPYFHSIPVKWIGESIPRTNFSTDLLHSFGAFMTICRIDRNNAVERLQAMRASKWQRKPSLQSSAGQSHQRRANRLTLSGATQRKWGATKSST